MRVGGLLVAVALAAVRAGAGDVPRTSASKKPSTELDVARVMVDEAVRQYAAGDAEAAYTAARNAYLDHFEYVEVPLRVRDEGLTLALEEDFAALRNQIEAGAPLADGQRRPPPRSRAASTTSSARSRSPASRHRSSRRCLLVHDPLPRGHRGGADRRCGARLSGGQPEPRLPRPVLLGVAPRSSPPWPPTSSSAPFFEIAPAQRELLEALTALAAVAVLFYVSFWLLSKVDHRRWMEFVRAQVWAATATGSMVALFGVGFTAVYREGVETALFYQALFGFSRGLEAWVLLGVAVASASPWPWWPGPSSAPGAASRFGSSCGVAVVVLIVMSVAFAGNTVRAFQQAALLPVTFLESLPRLPIFLADLTGWHPTLESIIAQIVLAAIYLAGAIWLFVIAPRRAAHASTPEPTGAAG